MKTFKDLITDIQEIRAISVAARRKIGRRMARLAKTASFQAKKARAMKKIASPMKQRIKANKMAKQVIIKKFYPKYDQFSPMQRAKTDQIIAAKYGNAITKIAKRMLLKVKKGEIEKVKKKKKKKKDD